MAKNPFDPKAISALKPFFKGPEMPSFPSEKALSTEYSGLQSFLGASDYSKQLQQAEDAAKLQAALSLAARGFASMGATPKRGESPFATVGRELLAPVGADLIPVATKFMERKAALAAAKKAEDRQVKLAALQSVRDRQKMAYAADVTATDAARQFLLMSQKRDVTPSTDYTVDGKPAPIIIEKTWDGKWKYKDTEGNEIPKDKIGVYKKGVKPFKSTVTKAKDIEVLVIDAEGKESWRPVEATITTHFDASGRPESTVMKEASTEQVLRLSGKKKNARKAPKPGSKTSAYFPPKSKDVYLTQDAVDVFEMNKNHVGKQATATTYLPKPDVGAGLPSFSILTVGGRVYDMRDHTGWDSKSETIKRELPSGKVSYASQDLWQVSKPGEGVERKEIRGQFFIPGSDQLSGVVPVQELTSYNMDGDLEKTYYAKINGKTTRITENQFFRYDERNEPFEQASTVLRVSGNELEALQSVKGFEGAKANEIVEVWTSKPVAGKGGTEQKQYRFRGVVVNIPNSVVSSSLQAREMSGLEKRTAGIDAPIYERGESLIVTPKALTAFRQAGLENVAVGDQVQVLFNKDKPSDRKFFYKENPIAPELVKFLQASPLSDPQQLEAGLKLRPFEPLDELNITDDKAVKWFEKKGLNVDVGDSIKVQISKGNPVAGVPDQFRYMLKGDILPSHVVKDAAFKSMVKDRGITDVEQRKAGQTFPERETYTNPTYSTVNISGISIPPGSSATLNQIQQRNANPDDLAKLRPFSAATDASPQPFMFSGEGRYGDYDYVPGDTLNLTGAKYLALPPEIKKLLSIEDKEKADILKKKYFKDVWKTVQKLEEGVIPNTQNKNRPPTESELHSLLGQFPTGRRGKNALTTAILRMLQDPGSVTPTATAAANVVAQSQTFADQVQAQLDSAIPRYTSLAERGALPNIPWDQLSYREKKSFASLPKKGMSEATVYANWQAAQKKLRDQMATFNIPKQSDSEEVAATASLKILTDYLLDSADMDHTGKLVGPFAELGANVFADYDLFTSSKSQRVNQIITLMRAHLRTLSSSEGKDARPSNYRLALQESLLPEFSEPEMLNKRNLETISRKLETSLRSLFTPESIRDNVIPQSWVKAAIEAGVQNAKVNPKLYASFMDPNDPINIDFELVTRAQIMEDLGKFKFQLPDFQSLRVGRPLPPDADGRVFIKISPTEVQLAKPGTYVPDTRAKKHVFR